MKHVGYQAGGFYRLDYQPCFRNPPADVLDRFFPYRVWYLRCPGYTMLSGVQESLAPVTRSIWKDIKFNWWRVFVWNLNYPYLMSRESKTWTGS